jgi:hypothetical protein
MTPERYRQIKSILQAALELDPAGQAAFLENACSGDPELKAEVQSLLDHDGESAGFLEQPPVAAGEANVRLKSGSHLGPYEIVEPIGAGGMGEVYRARDPRFPREVAIKLLPTAFADDQTRLARFEHEARAAGSLNHPNILTVHDFARENGASRIWCRNCFGEQRCESIWSTPPSPRPRPWRTPRKSRVAWVRPTPSGSCTAT